MAIDLIAQEHKQTETLSRLAAEKQSELTDEYMTILGQERFTLPDPVIRTGVASRGLTFSRIEQSDDEFFDAAEEDFVV